MSLKNFIKENFVLVTGLVLPALLILTFLIASHLPRASALPPAHELLFTVRSYDRANTARPYGADFFVKDGQVAARVWKNSNNNGGGYTEKVMAYDAKTETLREIRYDIPAAEDGNDGDRTLVLDAFKDLRVSGETLAPDGYTFENTRYSGGWPMRELFGGSYRDQRPRLVKGGAVHTLPDNPDGRYYYYDLKFLGWVTTTDK